MSINYYLKKNSIIGTIAKPKGITIAYIKARQSIALVYFLTFSPKVWKIDATP